MDAEWLGRMDATPPSDLFDPVDADQAPQAGSGGEGMQGADAMLLLTDWQQFCQLDWPARLPAYEPGLDAVEPAIAAGDMVFLSMNIAPEARGHTIAVERSTLPVRTAELVTTILTAGEGNTSTKCKSSSVLSNTEFLVAGLHPGPLPHHGRTSQHLPVEIRWADARNEITAPIQISQARVAANQRRR